jgi:hypothetical protein
MADETRTADEMRQFDFWLGDWDVRDPEGVLAGRNRIEPILGDTAIRETWEGESGHRGTSLNAWDPVSRVWRQAWIDVGGLWLWIEGGLVDGVMVMEGDRPRRDDPGRIVRHRISWSRVDGDADRLRQHWEMSEDGGGSWKTLFDGRYTRRT